MPTIEEINQLCRDIAEVTMADHVDPLEDTDGYDLDKRMLAMGPRAFGPDADEGANDCDGLFYWDLK